MKKQAITVALLLFVGVSLFVAVADVAGWRLASEESGETDGQREIPSLIDSDTKTRFTAIYFHTKHRCPTCETIEAYAHDALSSEIEQGNIGWKVADYTAEENKPLVKLCEVFTSTVVLVDLQDGKVIRWKNLEDVWNYTNDKSAFNSFINESWTTFKNTNS
tara:strand:+ start:1022 stop:1507 length:486 start_codon:yes stop_codon:yes gene_type:complete